MSALAHITMLKTGLFFAAVVVGCGLAIATNADETRNYSYPYSDSPDYVVSERVKSSEESAQPAPQSGFKLLSTALTASDLTLAARPSPYGMTSVAADVAAPVSLPAVARATTVAPMAVIADTTPAEIPEPVVVQTEAPISAPMEVQQPTIAVATAQPDNALAQARRQSAYAASYMAATSSTRAMIQAADENRKLVLVSSELASMGQLPQEAAVKSAETASKQGQQMVMAANDAGKIATLAPASGQPQAVITTVTSPPAWGAPVAVMPIPDTMPAQTVVTAGAPLTVAVVPVSTAPLPATPGGGAPVITTTVVTAPLPAIVATPPMPTLELPAVASGFPVGTEPKGLDRESKAIVNKLPPEKKRKIKIKAPVKIHHEKKNPLELSGGDEVRQHNAMGISIVVKRPKFDSNQILDNAYDALIAGNQEDAIALYKRVLDNDPNNKLALFGLATTYHRAGQLTLARPLYGKLLAIDPQNEPGLNNFLVLLADESPEQALDEMKRLQATHPDFSPLPAQMAVIYEKMGDYGQAVESMKHAIDLNPENIKYRYDMAVMLDKAGDWDDAAVFYQQLITAYERGEKIPAKREEIQERLTFIRSNRATVR